MSPIAIRQEPPRPASRRALSRAYERFQHLVAELGKFGVVGGVAFVVDTALYAYLLGLQTEPLSAKTMTTVVSATVAFVGNRFWTWRHRERSGLAREYTLYFIFNVVGLAIALAVLGLSHYGLGALWPTVFQTRAADLIAASIVGTAFGTLFRFWSYRRFVFLTPAVVSVTETPQVAVAGTDSNGSR